jgi:hypothetical protein
MICWKCGNEIQLDFKPARKDTCDKCGAYLKCCLNCVFYDPGAHNQCREPQAEWQGDKEKANFCEYFQPRKGGASEGRGSPKDDARKKLDDLFKD